MKINNISVVQRHERPSVLSKTALVMYFINDGQYQDPYAISGVTIFPAAANFPPSSIISDGGEILSSTSGSWLMHFSNSAAITTDSAFDTSNYTGASSDYGIYRLSEGKFACVLDHADNVPSGLFNLSGDNRELINRVSAVGDYLDVWTVLRVAGSQLDTYINRFTLTDDRFMAVTEPILLKIKTRLTNNKLVLGSKTTLKFTNEFTVENDVIDSEISNLFKYSLIENPKLLIYKENEDRNLPARVTVSGYADTSGSIDITSNNTMTYTFDTSILNTHPSVSDFGSLRGVYRARLEFDVLNETYVTDDMPFIIR